MERTLNNILGRTISKDNRSVSVRETETGYHMDRWDDDTNYRRLTYSSCADVADTIFLDMRLFLHAPFEDCNVERKTTTTH